MRRGRGKGGRGEKWGGGEGGGRGEGGEGEKKKEVDDETIKSNKKYFVYKPASIVNTMHIMVAVKLPFKSPK